MAEIKLWSVKIEAHNEDDARRIEMAVRKLLPLRRVCCVKEGA